MMVGMIAKDLIEALGMLAENQARQQQGKALAFAEDDFLKVIEENGIHHNAILGRLQRSGG